MRVYDPKCNQLLIAETVNANARIDGRKRNEPRKCSLTFGRDYGTVIVALGGTRVMAKATCEVTEPLDTRPAEGLMKISVDLSPMAAPSYSDTRTALEENVEIVRLLERSVRESKCIDMEGLCIESGSKCWRVRADVVALNSEGNLIEACSIALTAALAHFKRPDVTLTDEKLIIHSFDEKHPIPLTILHYPFCVKMCFFNEGSNYIIDPLEPEELAAEGYMVVSGNSHREVTTVHVTGKALLTQDVIMKCSSNAIDRIKILTSELKEALSNDKEKRDQGVKLSFAAQIAQSTFVLAERYIPSSVEINEDDEVIPEKHVPVFDEACRTRAYRFEGTAVGVGEGGPSQWEFMELADGDEDEGNGFDEDNDDDMRSSPPTKERAKKNAGSSDEEEVTELVLS